MNTKSLMQMLLDAGYPKEEMYNHESDLYIYVTPLTTQVLEDWCKVNGWHVELVKQRWMLFDIFTDNVTGRRMYDIAGQYVPWWAEKLAIKRYENSENMACR